MSAPAKKEIRSSDVACGDGQPTFVIAEIGSNHNQDLDLAFGTIDAAAEAGVYAVKFQTFQARSHYSKKTPGFSCCSAAEEKSLQFRRSLYVVEDLRAGDVLTRTNVRAIRPGLGLSPKYLEEVLGRRVSRDVPRGTALSWSLC